jgi:ferrous iron transport protein A
MDISIFFAIIYGDFIIRLILKIKEIFRMRIDLTKLEPGESGVVEEIQGGLTAVHKIQNISIRPGKKVKKISSHFMHGPQTVKIGHMQVAMGFGMAKKIFVNTEKHSGHK